MGVGLGCRHRCAVWQDSHHCSCNECGKVGEWFDDGFTLWRRVGATERARLAELSDATTVRMASVLTHAQETAVETGRVCDMALAKPA